MNNRKMSVALLLVVVLGGCAARLPDLVEQRIVSLEIVQPKRVRISAVDVEAQGKGMLVSGKLKRRGTISTTFSYGHIDVQVIGLGGIVLANVAAPYYPSRVPRRRTGESKFKTYLPIDPIPGTLVHIEHHASPKIDPDEHDTLRKL